MLHSPAASRAPIIRMKKAERNCSGASGSLDLFSSFLGLQVPVSQNLRSLSRSPGPVPSINLPTLSLITITCLAVVNDLLVEAVEVFGVAREGEAVARHGVPAADSEEATLVILPHQVLQHSPVVQEGVQVADGDNNITY